MWIQSPRQIVALQSELVHPDYFDIVNTLIPDDFKAFVLNAIRQNERKFVMKRKLDVEVAPEFVEMFRSFETLSSNILNAKIHRRHERFSILLGVSRKRKLIEMEEEEKVSSSQNELKSELDNKIRKIEDLKAQVN